MNGLDADYATLLVELTADAAGRCDLEAPRWDATGEHEGDFCAACASKLFPDDIDGGWTAEEDSPPFCESCAVPLDFTLTDYGVEEQLARIETEGIHSDHDAYCLHRLMNAGGHPLLTNSCGDWDYHPEWKPRIRAIYEGLV